MLAAYIKKLQAKGQLSFTVEQAMKELNRSYDSVLSSVYRLKKSGDIISPARGFYIIVPPGDHQFGSIPPEDIIVLLAKHLGCNYYACLLTAASYYGAAHQRPAIFQIFIDRRLKKELKFGKVRIEHYYKKTVKRMPANDVAVRTGNLKVSTPEVTAFDLLQHPRKSGGLNNVATVLSELIESIDPVKLLLLARQVGTRNWLQRFGYVLESIHPDDYSAQQRILSALDEYLQLEPLTYIPLATNLPIAGSPRSDKWKIIINTTVESDL